MPSEQKRVFIVCTGAGAGAQAQIWRTPGCSAYFAGAAFPYSEDQIAELIGFRPERSGSPETALDMAMVAYQRAFVPGSAGAIGIGLTGVVATTREHRSDHRLHAAVVTEDGVWAVDEILPKGTGAEARRRDGERADAMILGLLSAARGEVAWSELEARDRRDEASARFFERPVFTEGGERLPLSALGPGVLFPGAFNPPHECHTGIAAGSGERVLFAITVDPPHKPALRLTELLQRAKLLRGQRVVFTRGDPLYLEKARRFPHRSFVIGADALARMLDEKWGAPVVPMLDEFAALGTRFLVFGRLVEGRFSTGAAVLERFQVSPEHRALFRDLEGRWDVSSSEIRARS